MHGDLNQEQRERAMAAFKAGKKDILIATDVAARGIDVNDVTHVINHTVPDDPDTYLHRAGRTGRAGKTGIAVTFVDWADMHKWALINRGLEFGQPEPVETYSSSPHLFTDLDIPPGAKGRLQVVDPGATPRTDARIARAGGTASARSGSGASGSRPRQRTAQHRLFDTVGGQGGRHRHARRQGPRAPRRQRGTAASSPSARRIAAQHGHRPGLTRAPTLLVSGDA